MFIPSKKQTVEHLNEMQDEVNELHPVLNILFRKLPGIERVHYNQGSNELGADFILYKRDEALLRTSCVGVVVKAGAIRQNTTEVERQIKECFIARKAADGVEIQIREVWVVSSQDITRNAREVLTKLYSDRKIEFIASQDLAGLIDRFSPDAFITTSPALQDYAESMHSSMKAEDQRSLIVPGMEAFYVEPRVIRRDFDGYGNPKSSRAVQSLGYLVKEVLNSQLSIIQAGPGGGKSKLARELSRQLLEGSDYSEGKVVPIVVHAKDFQKSIDPELMRIASKLRKETGTDAKILIFMDGFDELDISDRERSAFVDEFIKAACAHNVSAVLMSRPFDLASVLGSRLQSLDIYQIEPLRGSRAISFLGKVAGNIDSRSRIVDDLSSSVLLRALDGAPIAYILLGRLIAENQQDLPSNLTELFQKYSELVLGRWEMTKGLRSQQEYEVLVEALIWLSVYMMRNELHEIGRVELEQWISKYCAERALSVVAKELVDKACSRNAVMYLRSDVGAVGFRHRAFCEFFYAKSMHRSSSVELGENVFSPYWINSYYFLAGIHRDCPDLIRSLSELELSGESDRIFRVLNFGNLMLAGYLTPTSVCKDAVVSVVSEAADLFVEACAPQSKSPLTEFPVLQMLCLLVSSFQSQYGYKHFKNSLEEAVFEFEARPATERVAIALLLLDTAYKEAGGELRFDTLIEKFGDSLPITVKLAIGHEADRMKLVSDRVKKLERNLRRTFQAHKGSREYLRKLYEIPIKKLDKPI
ncbi:hypothetical protein FB548_2670 [Pseudoxanthomonas sp. 3HH-4]|uniref:NACHT domain-containing protein n=1 Tax=Pseudoxanthomonas sp. 3HH-4 TaxID=1690214 RepID=UPI00115344CC|nr:hypothetical protein [Pseudoxanthomonas sp. 3HH-4]TQM10467.1 hypothetical protein FB548_2670 [Pseudoxanthomonas sp. 3HH-4]